MNFFFPSEPAATDSVPAIQENPLGDYLSIVLADAMGSDVIRPNPAGTMFDVLPDLPALLSARRVENRAAVLRMASLQESPGEIPKERPEAGWLHLFLTLSEAASSDLEREVWARLLALEVAEPKSVSRRTLHSLREMDLWELEAFVEYCAFAFSFESGSRFMFEGEIARRELWAYGREIDLTQHWIDVGLLSSEPATLALRNATGLRVLYRSKSWEVSLNPEARADDLEHTIRYRKFSAIGQQISSALSFKAFNGYARNLIKALEGQGHAIFRSLPDEG